MFLDTNTTTNKINFAAEASKRVTEALFLLLRVLRFSWLVFAPATL